MIGQPSNRFVQQKKEKDFVFLLFLYPDPGSNRDGLPHWCLRPARLPIPPSGHTLYRDCGCKDRENFLLRKKFSPLFSFYFSRLTPPTLRVGASAPLRRILLRKKSSPLFSFYFSRPAPARQPQAARHCLIPPEGAWAFPLRYNVHAHVIVSSPGFSLWLNPAPRGGVRCTPVIV